MPNTVPQGLISFGVCDGECQHDISQMHEGMVTANGYECTFNKKSTAKSFEEILLTIPDEGIDINKN